MKQSQPRTHLESFHPLQTGTFLYSYSHSLPNFLKRLQLFNAWVTYVKMSCLALPLCDNSVYPVSRAEEIHFLHFSSLLFRKLLFFNYPDNLDFDSSRLAGWSSCSLCKHLFSLRLLCLSSIMSFLERTFYLGLFLPLPIETGCQDAIYNADREGLQNTGLLFPLWKGNVSLCRLMEISMGELVLPIPVLM